MADQVINSNLKFAPIRSLVDAGFWHMFQSLKLNKLGIDDSPIPITGFIAPCSHRGVSNHLSLYAESLPLESGEQSSTPASIRGNRNRCPVPGILYNTNTFESFKDLDKQSLLKAEAKKIWEDIESGKVDEDSSLLLRFLVISFADLKTWNFNYWFAFPALMLDPPATLVDIKPASQYFSLEEAESLKAACNNWRNTHSTTDVPFFLVSVDSNSAVTIKHLSEFVGCQRDGHKVLFGFYDPCNLPNNPGWPLRNLLFYIFRRWGCKMVQFFCYREHRGFADLELSLVGEASILDSQAWIGNQDMPKVVGWELNNKFNKKDQQSAKHDTKPYKCMSLSETMDPTRLAIAAADMNLKLMKWRVMPTLNTDMLSSTRCLLLGAGTLGCHVAQNLMAWGVRKITFLDSGKVSMSNPLRQTLYTLDDCLNGGKFKATAAAQNLSKSSPTLEAEGVVMAIPMPGHPVTSQEEKSVLKDCKQLHDLIDSHDVVFLLTDTRESRWLPSLLCANANKIAMTAALGFDTFLVMRHGGSPNGLCGEIGSLSLTEDIRSQRLGCYFCNDVVAPIDSTSNRTLDQQCTVTLPGVAPNASSHATELLIKILHHPSRILAKAESANSKTERPLGILPHQIRGNMYQFTQMLLKGYASPSCTACSSTVVDEYRKRGDDFLLEAINHPTYLEDITGLTELMKSAGAFDLVWDDDDDDEDGECVEIN